MRPATCFTLLIAAFQPFAQAQQEQARILLAETEGMRIYHYGSDDHRRYGRFLSFTINEEMKMADGNTFGFLRRHLVACDGSWSTGIFSSGAASSRQERFLPAPERGEFQPARFETGLDGLPESIRQSVSRNLPAWCGQAKSTRSDEISLFRGASNADYLVVQTLKINGSTVEAWLVRMPWKIETMKKQDGSAYRTDEGGPVTYTTADTAKEYGMFRAAYHCDRQAYSLREAVTYNPDGSLRESRVVDIGLKPSTVVPHSQSQAVLNAVCLIAKSL